MDPFGGGQERISSARLNVLVQYYWTLPDSVLNQNF